MKRKQVVLLLMCSIMALPVGVSASTKNMALMTCSKGDRLDISLDSKNVKWTVSDEGIAEVKDGIIYIKEEGKCDIVNKKHGYTIKLTSEGESKGSSVLELNYSTRSSDMLDVDVDDNTVKVETVEVNEGVALDSLTSNSSVSEGSIGNDKQASRVEELKNSIDEDEVTKKLEELRGENAEYDEDEYYDEDDDEDSYDEDEEDVEAVEDEEDKESVSSNSSDSDEDADIAEVVDFVDDTTNSNIINPGAMENVKKDEDVADGVVSTPEEGVYASESDTGEVTVLRVVAPELNHEKFNGYMGESLDIDISNSNCDVVYSSDDTDVAVVDQNGLITLVGEGKTTVFADTEYNRLKCKIESKAPTVDEDDVYLTDEDEEYEIEVEDNKGDLPVSYRVIKGKGDGKVTKNGIVTVDEGKEITVKISVGNLEFKKKFSYVNNHESYWDAMQPAIKECLGTPYVFGGNSPGKGLDCSAYVSYVYRTVGLVNGRYTAQGLYNMAKKTTNPKPGDMVFFHSTYSTSDYVTHIGIYAGDGYMYHSGDPNQKASLNTPYWKQHLVGYGTMIKDDIKYIGNGSPSTKYLDKYTKTMDKTGYSQKDLELIWAIVGQECSSNYEGALAVVSSAYNRAKVNWGGYGTDVLSQLTAPSQYCYSPAVSPSYLWQRRLNGNVSDFVKQAVSDCLTKGVTNHNYHSFRSYPTGSNCVNIGGNWYF